MHIGLIERCTFKERKGKGREEKGKTETGEGETGGLINSNHFSEQNLYLLLKANVLTFVYCLATSKRHNCFFL